jgi:hypothetical protein
MTDLDLVNWTMQQARQLNSVHHAYDEIKCTGPLEDQFWVLDGGAKPSPTDTWHVSDWSDELMDSAAAASPISKVVEEFGPTIATHKPATIEVALPILAEGQPTPISTLLEAIAEPDIYTSSSDRDRAIVLRWVLRDIKGNRLKLSPVDQQDLQDLIDLKLVKMMNDAPVLTEAGVDALQ